LASRISPFSPRPPLPIVAFLHDPQCLFLVLEALFSPALSASEQQYRCLFSPSHIFPPPIISTGRLFPPPIGTLFPHHPFPLKQTIYSRLRLESPPQRTRFAPMIYPLLSCWFIDKWPLPLSIFLLRLFEDPSAAFFFLRIVVSPFSLVASVSLRAMYGDHIRIQPPPFCFCARILEGARPSSQRTRISRSAPLFTRERVMLVIC